MKLPNMRYTEGAAKREVVALRGLNYGDSLQDGDLVSCENLSARRYPYLSTRRPRARQTDQSGPTTTALTAWGKLVAVQGTELTYDGKKVGEVTAGEKQFAVVNTKLVIWPDKVYLDLTNQSVKPLGAKAQGTGGSFTANALSVAWETDLTTLFRAGDCVTISGCTAEKGNNLDVVLTGVEAKKLTVAKNTFAAKEETGTLTIERKIPELDYICESENRLWGVSNAKQTIYASAMGDPTNFFTYEGLATDSYALAVGSEGIFTGCCKLSSSVLFWKETTLHKILGGYPAEYSLYSYNIEGLQKGCHKSLQVINEVLFYKGLHGVYAYSGGTPTLVSACFGEREFSAAVAGNDGDSYYLSVLEGGIKPVLFVYETRQAMWLREDETRAKDFARIGKDLYLLDEAGNTWRLESSGEDKSLAWHAQFAPLYETIEGRKRYSKLLLRVELPAGSYLKAKVRWDGAGRWQTVGDLRGKEETTALLRIPPRRCDKLELRLEGRGPFALLSWLREFRLGSDV